MILDSNRSARPSRDGYGIDIGSSNGYISRCDGNRARVIPDATGKQNVSMVIFFSEHRHVVSPVLLPFLQSSPQRISHFRDLIGRKYTDPLLQMAARLWPFHIVPDPRDGISAGVQVNDQGVQRTYSGEQLLTFIFSYFFLLCETPQGNKNNNQINNSPNNSQNNNQSNNNQSHNHHNNNENIDNQNNNVVLVVPFGWPSLRTKRLCLAAQNAGWNVLDTLSEPLAAVVAYDLDRLPHAQANSKQKPEQILTSTEEKTEDPQHVLVFSMGATSLDVSIVRIFAGKPAQVVASRGDAYLGGDDFVQVILAHCIADFNGKNRVNMGDNFRAVVRLRVQIEEAFLILWESGTAHLELEALFEGIDYRAVLRRPRCEDWTRSLVQQAHSHVRAALRDAGLRPTDVPHVVLSGGASKISSVVTMLETEFPRPALLHKTIPPQTAAANGAAIWASRLLTPPKQDDFWGICDVLPLTHSVATADGLVVPVAPRNCIFPTRISALFSTAQDNQTSVTLTILEGERPFSGECNTLATLELVGISPALRGTPEINVTFDIDANGILEITALDAASGSTAQTTVSNDKGRLSPQMVNRSVTQAEENFGVDSVVRARQAARHRLLVHLFAMRQDNFIKLVEKFGGAIQAQNLATATEEGIEWVDAHPNATEEEYSFQLLQLRCIVSSTVRLVQVYPEKGHALHADVNPSSWQSLNEKNVVLSMSQSESGNHPQEANIGIGQTSLPTWYVKPILGFLPKKN